MCDYLAREESNNRRPSPRHAMAAVQKGPPSAICSRGGEKDGRGGLGGGGDSFEVAP